MSEVITLHRAYEAKSVRLGDNEYKTRQITRSVQAGIIKTSDELDDAGDDQDKIVALLAKQLDYLLKAESKQAKPSTIVNKSWKADELPIDDLVALVERLSNDIRPN